MTSKEFAWKVLKNILRPNQSAEETKEIIVKMCQQEIDSRTEGKLAKVSYLYAHKLASKKLDPKEWNDYMLQHLFTGEDISAAFEAGAKWKEDMHINEACEGRVINTEDGKKLVIPALPYILRHFKDKVKVLVLKREI